MKAIIGGTGLESIEGFDLCTSKTPYGEVKYYRKGDILFFSRHGKSHHVPPHKVNYKGNVWAMREAGVDEAVGIFAVGSITDILKPGEFCAVEDFVDVSGRNITLFDENVKHVSMECPFDPSLQKSLAECGVPTKGIYVTTSGPRFETKAEIRMFRAMGADYVGMTLGSEATLMAEIGIAYAAVAYSINWAAGMLGGMGFISDSESRTVASDLRGIVIEMLSSRT